MVNNRSFNFVFGDHLRLLFKQSGDIRLRVWGSLEFGEVEYVTLDGTIHSGGECVFAYEAFKLLDRRKSDELGRLSLWGFPSSLIRKIIDEGGYIHAFVNVYLVPNDENLMRVDKLELIASKGKEVEIKIGGLGEYRQAEIVVRSEDGEDEWFIGPDGELEYLGPMEREVERMPAWLKKAWLEYRW